MHMSIIIQCFTEIEILKIIKTKIIYRDKKPIVTRLKYIGIKEKVKMWSW